MYKVVNNRYTIKSESLFSAWYQLAKEKGFYSSTIFWLKILSNRQTKRYEKHLTTALTKGRELKFDAHEYPRTTGLLIKKEHIDTIKIELLKKIKGNISNLTGNCFPTHTEMKPIIESILGVETYYTIGYLKIDGEFIHKMELDDLFKRLSPDTQITDTLNLHAWITLPTMEIIDLTTMTTKNVAQNNAVNELEIIHGYSGKDDIEYYPQIAATY